MKDKSWLLGLLMTLSTGALLGISGCNDDNTPLPPAPPVFSLDMFLYRTPREVEVNKTAIFGGYLIKNGTDTLSGERIYFSFHPDTLGYISPNPHWATTDASDEDGFIGQVRFVGLKVGTGYFRGSYRGVDGGEIANDTVWVQIIPPGNQ